MRVSTCKPKAPKKLRYMRVSAMVVGQPFEELFDDAILATVIRKCMAEAFDKALAEDYRRLSAQGVRQDQSENGENQNV